MKTFLATFLVLLFCLPSVSITADEEPIKDHHWKIPLVWDRVVVAQCLEAMEKGLQVQTGAGDERTRESYFFYEGVVYRIRFYRTWLECRALIPMLTEAEH